jgi:hypothetical protein
LTFAALAKNDLPERSAQVTIMRGIYVQAAEVLVGSVKAATKMSWQYILCQNLPHEYT